MGNPLGFMSDISSGISDLAEMDFSGLVRNVAHGVGDSTAKVGVGFYFIKSPLLYSFK